MFTAMSGFEKVLLVFFGLLFIVVTVGHDLVQFFVNNPIFVILLVFGIMLFKMITTGFSQYNH